MADPCLFIKRDGDKVMIIGVYVDDIILAHKNIDLNEDFIKVFCGPKGFNSKHLGKLNWFLSIGLTNMMTTVSTYHKSYTLIN